MDNTPHVLIVEDDEGVARLVGNAVKETGCEYSIVPTGSDALAWCAERRADLMLLDNVLPDMTANELLENAEEGGVALCPFIVTTGNGSEMLAVELMKRGAVDYIVKDADFLDRIGPAVKRAMESIRGKRKLEEVEAALRQYAVETEAILDLAPHGILTFNGEGEIITANRKTAELYGTNQEKLNGVNIAELLPEKGGMPLAAVPGKTSVRDVKEYLNSAHEFVGTRVDGTTFEGEVVFSKAEASLHPLYIAIIRDVTEYKSIERQLVHDAFHDKLTGLPNRALVQNRIDHALTRRHENPGWRCAVLFVDLDRFKLVNDTLGHTAGDQLLIEAAKRIKKQLRPDDTIGRIGGDDFLVLVEDIHDVRNAIHVCERILQGLEDPITINGQPVHSNASIGVAFGTNDVERGEELIRRADIAMYRAKENGRGRFEVFEDDMHSRTSMLLKLENDLRKAVREKEFVLHYQPVIDLVERKVAGFEALVRWARSGSELVSPGVFIPLAEETGLISDIGRQVLYEACRQNREWMDLSGKPCVMNVNMSAHQLQRDDVVSMVRDILNDLKLPTSSLHLELTEGVFVDYGKGDLEVLDELAAMGVGLAIDDFGTGYSSFSYLSKLPVQTLKLDRSFIMGLPHNSDHVAIATAILAMAKAMGLDVVAEGVEELQQLKFLMQHGCLMAQGYYFSRPVAAEHAEASLHKNIEIAV